MSAMCESVVPHRRLRIISVGAVVAVLLGGFALAAAMTSTAGASDIDYNTEGLTYSEVARQLDLERNTDDLVVGCALFVGSPGDGGYCLDQLPVTVDDWTREHIAIQLMGYEDNAAMHAYIDAQLEVTRILDAKGYGYPELLEANQRLKETFAALTKLPKEQE